MSNLHVCYSPKGEKFELSRPNFLDATQNFGFTTNPPASAEQDEADGAPSAESPVEPTEEVEAVETVEEAEEPVSEEVTEAPAKEELPYDAADKNSVKEFLRSKGIEFDGRSSLDDLLKLAEGVEA